MEIQKRKEIVCCICKKKFKKLTGLGVHISTIHSMSCKDYYNLYLKKDKNEGICSHCNINKTSFLDLRRGFCDFCSVLCAQLSDEVKMKKENTYLKNFGMTHYMKTEDAKQKHNFKDNNRAKAKQTIMKNYGVENVSQILDIKKKKEITCLKNFGTPNPFLNKDVRKKAKLTIKERYGVDNYSMTNEFRSIVKKNMIDGGAAHCNRFIKNPSKPQVELFKLCQEVFPYPILNYPSCGYSIDIAIPSLNIAIEYDGSYWHQDEEYDNKRQLCIEDDGWSFIRYKDYIPSKDEILIDSNKILNDK